MDDSCLGLCTERRLALSQSASNGRSFSVKGTIVRVSRISARLKCDYGQHQTAHQLQNEERELIVDSAAELRIPRRGAGVGRAHRPSQTLPAASRSGSRNAERCTTTHLG